MASRFHALPVDLFESDLQPYMSRFNFELRQLFGLEGALREPVGTKRSDGTVIRSTRKTVHITRVTPDIGLESPIGSLVQEIVREASLGPPPNSVIFRVKAGPPDELYVSMKITGGTWQWLPIVFAP